MNLVESLRIAMRGLSANKLRSALTMLGIIIGVGAVITLLSVGEGVQNLITSQLQSAGTNLLIVLPVNIDDSAGQGGQFQTRSFEPSLTLSDLQAVRDPFNVPDVVAAAPEVDTRSTVSYQKNSASLQISGVTPEYETVRNSRADIGAFISQQDVDTRARVVVLGVRAMERLFEPGDYPIGRTIKIDRIPFTVIGVLEEKGGGAFGSEDDIIYAPLSTVQERLAPNLRNSRGEPLLSVVYAQVVSEDRMSEARTQIEDLLRVRHNIQFRDDDDFSVINQADLIAIFGQITGVLTIFLGAIAAISLLVGGIGIMNIMLVSVTERTREIGIRKAVGARRKDILSQFLIEAVVLSLIGGLCGILLGWAGAMLISQLQSDLTAVVTIQSIALAVGFSAAVGLFFGIYPATRAASLNPIDALRYE
ncbi:MAG: ABC transporter permease [Anaerolineae bacterium]|nr:ABC transporter permease [Anaerolineae bacterium]MCB9129591.1 ABC transporter permease [Anaerolineales bacterium]MCB0228168.1 ABC transporter permease [Anaerolineae bacterium]MCB0238313.1 ABC transporter permease [Anaerolineae bacterium]MCB0248727.1 ABC transporter permease [Anaerolineae bacterium]